MDESELVKTGMEIILRPVTEIAENALGLAGGDWLSEKRVRNRVKLKQKTEDILKARGANLDEDPSPTVVLPLLSAAQDEGREELINMWAGLLAAASDPERRARYRREFVGVARELEPVDAAVLNYIGQSNARIKSDERAAFCQQIGMTPDQLEISLKKLLMLGLLDETAFKNSGNARSTALAREFCQALAD